MADLLLDLGDDGQVVLELVGGAGAAPAPYGYGTEQVGLGETIQQVRAEASRLLKLPLTGMAKLFLASLPAPDPQVPYELSQFSVEFNLGIKAEAGSNVGAVAKIMPEGVFKCTYTWKQKPVEPNKT